MKLIEQRYEIIGECPTNREESLEWIEVAGRICYQSQSKGEAEKFVMGLCKSGHTAMVEHSNIVYKTRNKCVNPVKTLENLKILFDNKFLNYCIENDYIYVDGNWRAWNEANNVFASYNGLPRINFIMNFSDMELVQDTKEIPMQLKRIMVIAKTSRAVTHELVRHRPMSFAQESQRYCAYRDELEFIVPSQYLKETQDNRSNYLSWMGMLKNIEALYKQLLKTETPQEARHILPNCTATQIVMTTTIPHWNFIFSLRDAKTADPNMQILMKPLHQDFIDRGWII
jgi:thymidylate synthase (FAD)